VDKNGDKKNIFGNVLWSFWSLLEIICKSKNIQVMEMHQISVLHWEVSIAAR
jgi:hypothetical protein